MFGAFFILGWIPMNPMLVFLLLTWIIPLMAQHQSVLGKWETIDDRTGEIKSIVELFERDGKVYGRILKIFPKPEQDQDPVCEKCSVHDPRHKKKIIGMEILRDLKVSGGEYDDGNILDPEVGKVYRCKIWIEQNNLKVRGYWGPFWRTQTWKPVP
jgi:uncharacterized protein (DUF2147 family)